jgi:hypothetical protein
MKLIDVLKGTGTVVSGTGNTFVQYDLKVYETEIQGWIRPHFGEEKERLTLRMQDGSTVRFMFMDTQGTVMATGIQVAID